MLCATNSRKVIQGNMEVYACKGNQMHTRNPSEKNLLFTT